MKYTVRPNIDPDELRKLVQLRRGQFIGKFSVEEDSVAEEAFENISSDFTKLLEKAHTTKLALVDGNQTKGVAIIDESKWDSDILDLKYGKMKLLCFHPETDLQEKGYFIENLVNKLEKEGFKLVVVRIPMDDVSTINALEREGAIVTDVLVTFQRDAKNFSSSQVSLAGVRIVEADADDKSKVMEIGKSVFKIDHFHSDQRLPKDKSDELYAKWTENSFHGLVDAVLMAKEAPDVLGFITCKTENLTPNYKYGVIDLVGVAKGSEGKGIGTALVAEALKWFSKRVSSVYVGTQAGNVGALRLYEKSGFKAVYTEATLHLWLR